MNIQNNRFISIKEDVVDKLVGMQKLENLWINLSREEEVEIIKPEYSNISSSSSYISESININKNVELALKDSENSNELIDKQLTADLLKYKQMRFAILVF